MPDVRSAVHKEDLELYVRGPARDRSDRSIFHERELIGEAIIALEDIARRHGGRSCTFPGLDDNLEAQSPKDVAVRQAVRKPAASSLR